MAEILKQKSGGWCGLNLGGGMQIADPILWVGYKTQEIVTCKFDRCQNVNSLLVLPTLIAILVSSG